jgi:NAD(P)-dependent dehydrogenase (short-subunit alcohol dehydrogenase family)
VIGRVAVVTGASAGVGRAIAVELARRGASIGLLARGSDGLEGARRDVERAGGRALVVPTDVADADAVERAADLVERELGPIDVWINDAMVTVFAPALHILPEEFARVTAVTYLGTVHGTLAALRRMKARDRGHIIQVGSALAHRAIPLQSAYCAAKHAVRGFTDSIRSELIHDRSNVHLTMVQLPAMNTPQFTWGRVRMPNEPQPVPPIFQPEVAASAIVSIIGKRRRELWLAGSTVKAIVGTLFFPGLLDSYLAKVGYTGQQTDRALAADRTDNLFHPVPGDHGMHGPFGDRAKRKSTIAWASVHRPLLMAAAVLLVLGLAALSAARASDAPEPASDAQSTQSPGQGEE